MAVWGLLNFCKRLLPCMILSSCLLAGGGAAYAGAIDKVIAVVNDEVVTQREFDRAFLPIRQSYEGHFKGEELERRLEELRKEFLEQLVNSKLVISLAKKEEIKIDEEELKSRIERIKAFYDSEEDFLRALSVKGTNLSEFREELREQMLAQKLVEKEVAAGIVITPGEVRDLYEKNRDKLMAPKKVKARTIMIRKTDGSAEVDQRRRIEEIVSELESGKDFASLAAERSEGPYAENGGDMGFVIPGQMLKEIDDAIFSLEKGDVSGIVETSMGYHVFLAEDTEEPRPLGLEEASDFLREQLFMKRFEEEMAGWIEEKRKHAYISYK